MDFLWNIVSSAPIVSSILCSALVALLVLLSYRTKNTFSYWQRKGVKGPRPWPIVGNFIQLLIGDRMRREREWAREFGKLYGIYQGVEPRLVVADAEILQQICVKDFDVLPNHETNEFFNNYQKSFLFLLQDEQWKRTRAFMSPTFTSGKIKRMFRLLDACADDLVDCFGEQIELRGQREASEKKKAEISLKDVYNLYTMDAIATCCYGLKLERVSGSADLKTAATRNDFVRLAMQIFDFNPFRLALLLCFPKSLLRFFDFKVAADDKFVKLSKVMQKLIDQRRDHQVRGQKKFDDYLQLLIDAKLDDEMDLNEMDSEENHHAGLTHESLRQDQKRLTSQLAAANGSQKSPADGGQPTAGVESTKLAAAAARLSELEIVSSAMFLLIVGLETTSSLLTHCTYLLAFHPEIQEKLCEEVSKIADHNDEKKTVTFSYESLTSCHYLDSVLGETLRIFSPILLTDRVARRDWDIEKYKIHLPAGSRVSLALHAVMNDPDYWEEPQKFDPQRFMPGNKEKIVPGSYCPFGLGPRHCLGMRFSLTEAKLALAKMILKYRFERAPGTEFPPELKLNFGLVNMKRPNVIVSLRSD